MAYRILILDDEYDDRRDVYAQLGQSDDCPYEFEITGRTDLKSFEAAYRDSQWDAVLLDIILARRTDSSNDDDIVRGQHLEAAIEIVGDDCPVAFISNVWSRAPFEKLRNIWDLRPLKYAFSYAELAQSPTVVALQLATMIKRSRRLSTIALKGDDPLRILHLSDFHFGLAIGGQDAEVISDYLNIKNISKEVRSFWPELPVTGAAPLFVLVTGDVGNEGAVRNYELAYAWFKDLLQEFNLTVPCDRLLLVPGNHDACMPLVCAEHIGYNFLDKTFGRLEKPDVGRTGNLAFFPFQKFAFSMTGVADWVERPSGAWVDSRFTDHGVLFFGLNSAVSMAPNAPKATFVPEEHLRSVDAEIENCRKRANGKQLFHIGLLHHPPSPDKSREFVDPQEKFVAYVDRWHPCMLLHGHVHARRAVQWDTGKSNALVMSAFAPRNPKSKQAIDEARGFNLIEVA